MGKVRYRHHPRSIVQERRSKKSRLPTLLVTIPRGTVNDWQVKSGDILEFIVGSEGNDSFVKVRKVKD